MCAMHLWEDPLWHFGVKSTLHVSCQLYIVEYNTADADSKASFTIIQQKRGPQGPRSIVFPMSATCVTVQRAQVNYSPVLPVFPVSVLLRLFLS